MTGHTGARDEANLGDLLDQIEPAMVRALVDDGQRARRCAGVVLAEAPSSQESYRDQVVLGLGLRPGDPGFASSVLEIAAAGAAALIVRDDPERSVGATLEQQDPAGLALVVVRADTDWVQLAQLLRAANTAYSSKVATGIPIGDLFGLANTLSALLDGAVSIVDVPGRVLGYSTHAGHPIDEVRRASTLALEELVHPSRDEDYRRLTRTAGAAYFAGIGDHFGRVAIAVRSAGEMLGTVWVIQVEDATWRETAALLESVEPLVALHMAHSRTTATSKERRSSDLLRALFADEGFALQAADELAIGPGRAHAVVCFGLDEGPSSNPVRQHQQLLHVAEVSASVNFGWSRCALIGGVTVALVASDDPDAVRAFAEGVAQASSGAVRAGIGGQAGTVPEIARSYREALSTYRIMLQLMHSDHTHARSRRTATFDEVRVELGLARVGEFLANQGLTAADELERIRRYDARHDTEYEATLAVYLDAQGSIRETAERLRVHQNTVRYRMDRLGAELGIRLEDPATRLWLWLRLMTARNADRFPG